MNCFRVISNKICCFAAENIWGSFSNEELWVWGSFSKFWKNIHPCCGYSSRKELLLWFHRVASRNLGTWSLSWVRGSLFLLVCMGFYLDQACLLKDHVEKDVSGYPKTLFKGFQVEWVQHVCDWNTGKLRSSIGL